MKRIAILLMLMFSLSGCIGTIVGTAVDVGVEAVKVPFKVGGAIYDGVSGDDEEEPEPEEEIPADEPVE